MSTFLSPFPSRLLVLCRITTPVLIFKNVLRCNVRAVYLLISDGQMTARFSSGTFAMPARRAAGGELKEKKEKRENVPNPRLFDPPHLQRRVLSEVVPNPYAGISSLRKVAAEDVIPYDLAERHVGWISGVVAKVWVRVVVNDEWVRSEW